VAAFTLSGRRADGNRLSRVRGVRERDTLHRKALSAAKRRQTALLVGSLKIGPAIKNHLPMNSTKRILRSSYPLQRALVRHLSIPAEKVGRTELLPLCGGTERQLIAVCRCACTAGHACKMKLLEIAQCYTELEAHIVSQRMRTSDCDLSVTSRCFTV